MLYCCIVSFVISQIVDQALALTPGVPESLRENIVERVEEGSREYVRKATDPRQQALWREQAQRGASSAWKIARGGGGTSRASGQIYRETPTGHVNAETGEFSIITTSDGQSASGGSSSSSSSVHSFFPSPNVNVTTVVTVSFLSVAPAELAVPVDRTSVPSGTEPPSARQLPSQISGSFGEAAVPARDSGMISGRDW